jgi:competence protein ComEC
MKTGLPDDLSENLRTVGLTHIVVASGAHLAILVGIAEKIFGKISRFSGVLFSGLFIIAFMILVGWTPSIMRAGMMAILTLMLRYVGRRTMPFRMILMVMAITLMVEPSFVMNMGWMLSFASYAGITMVGPRFTKFFYGNKKPKFIGTTVLTTLAATVMTLPIVLYYYGQVSLISVIANLLILPTLPYAMGMTFMVGAFVGIPGVGVVVAWCAKMLLSFHIVVVGWFGGMPEFLVKIPMGQVWVFVLYVPVAIMLLWGKGQILVKGILKWKHEQFI